MKIEEMIVAKRADCCGCEACANVCPKNAITMTRDAEGFAYPKINRELCIKCGKCDATCPSLNFTAVNVDAFPETFVAIHPDKKILRHSSSGGAFTALSEIILREGGIVFGAGFDKNWHVIHTAAKSLDELENLRGSKYTQSQIGDVYRQVRDALKSSKVLFSGTPCQCVGLKHFLGGDHNNLLTVDIICHGTPSPGIWENYIGELGYSHEITSVNFRSKRNGWRSDIDINFSDRGQLFSANMKNLYGKLFLNSLSERPSCHACKAKFPNNRSDLTIGDAWGVKDFAPEMFDSRGVSLIFVHTAKGKKFFEQTTLKTQAVDFLKAITKNTGFIMSFSAEPRRKEFFADFAKAADKLAVMEKYFAHDLNETARKKVDRKNDYAFVKAYNEIAAQIREKIKQNFLIVTTYTDDEVKKFLLDYFERHFPNSGLYILRLADDGNYICTENFSALTFNVKDEVDAIAEFVNQLNVEKVIIEKTMKFNTRNFINWLKTSGLSAQAFSRK